MRNEFARVVTELADHRDDICLLSGDIGNRMFDKFKERAPSRFFNCGIAEGNMMSVAAGLATCGLRPIVYTITPFTTARCFEQIRVGVAYHEVPVVIIGTGSGLSYAELGATHHSLEDIAILRTLPNLNILTPVDKREVREHLMAALETDGPTYIRIGKKGEPDIHTHSQPLGIGKGAVIREGRDVALVCSGPIIAEALEAAKTLDSQGLSVGVASIGSIKPLDSALLEELRINYRVWITVEEHWLAGGLGSALLEWLNMFEYRDVSIKRLGAPDKFIHKLGSQEFCRKNLEIDRDGIAKAVTTLAKSEYSG